MLERLIDHAALFPPASIDPGGRAGGEQGGAGISPYAWLLNRCVSPAAPLGELDAFDAPGGRGARFRPLEAQATSLDRGPARWRELLRLAGELAGSERRGLLRATCSTQDFARLRSPPRSGRSRAVGGRVKLRSGGAILPRSGRWRW